jgi:hypothetical protein
MAADCKWFIINIFMQIWRLISRLYQGKVLFCYEFSGALQEQIRQHSP